MKFILPLFFALTSHAALPPTTMKGQDETAKPTTFNFQAPYYQATTTGASTRLIETGNNNVLVNPGFEATTTQSGWTVNFSTPQTDTTGMFEGKKALVAPIFGGAGVQLEQTYANCSRFVGQNLEASIYIKSTATTGTVCSLSNGSEYQCMPMDSSGVWKKHTLNLPGPSTGSCGIRVNSSGLAAVNTIFDKAYLGLATNLSQVSQATFYGGATQIGGANCAYAQSTSTGESDYVTLGTAPSCASEWSSYGNCVATGPTAHSITCSNMPPGDYKVEVSAPFGTSFSGANGNFRFFDGTNEFGFKQIYSASSATNTSEMLGRITYTTSGTRTFVIQGSDGAASGNTAIGNQDAGRRFIWRIWRFPTTSQIAVNSAALPWRVDASIGGGGVNVDIPNTLVTSYDSGVLENSSLTIAPNYGSDTSVQIGCAGTTAPSGSTCSSANESVSVSFIPPKACNAMKVCFKGTHIFRSASGGLASVLPVFTVTKTSLTSQTATATASQRIAVGASTPAVASSLSIVRSPFETCGTFQTDTSRQLFRLRYVQPAATSTLNQLLTDQAIDDGGGKDVNVTAQCLDDQQPAPLIIGSVISSDTVRAEGAQGVTSIASSNFVPSYANSTNVAASSNLTASYTRIGKFVHVWGRFNATCASGTSGTPVFSDLRMTVPVVGANFASNSEATGRVNSWDGGSIFEEGGVGSISGTTTVQLIWGCKYNTSQVRNFYFDYEVK